LASTNLKRQVAGMIILRKGGLGEKKSAGCALKGEEKKKQIQPYA